MKSSLLRGLHRWLWGLGLIVCLTIASPIALPVQGAILEQQEAAEQMLYQSRTTLRDNSDQAWQVVFFKRIKRKQAITHLRLIAFPDSFTFTHPQPLQITFNEGAIAQAPDRLEDTNPAANVGEFDLGEILPQWQENDPYILLTLNRGDRRTVSLKVPYFLVQEWQEVSRR